MKDQVDWEAKYSELKQRFTAVEAAGQTLIEAWDADETGQIDGEFIAALGEALHGTIPQLAATTLSSLKVTLDPPSDELAASFAKALAKLDGGEEPPPHWPKMEPRHDKNCYSNAPHEVRECNCGLDALKESLLAVAAEAFDAGHSTGGGYHGHAERRTAYLATLVQGKTT